MGIASFTHSPIII
ncbi:hypothetical protein M8C21_023755 [Ambrosia artemisiifolia]|uniref:Uncharacterized protein n=1 Tax=Ambrosia artemisiifolia TaxID=4212 RepID=A0AAD5CNE4_AMBAR|nr:hypothetical protein M8C21_023755 [Ambrosia artemisiifolia]